MAKDCFLGVGFDGVVVVVSIFDQEEVMRCLGDDLIIVPCSREVARAYMFKRVMPPVNFPLVGGPACPPQPTRSESAPCQ